MDNVTHNLQHDHRGDAIQNEPAAESKFLHLIVQWRLLDECLNENWSGKFDQAHDQTQAWRRACNSERRKKRLDGLMLFGNIRVRLTSQKRLAHTIPGKRHDITAACTVTRLHCCLYDLNPHIFKALADLKRLVYAVVVTPRPEGQDHVAESYT